MECNKLYYFILYSANFWAPRNFSPLVLSVLHIKTRDEKKKILSFWKQKEKKYWCGQDLNLQSQITGQTP